MPRVLPAELVDESIVNDIEYWERLYKRPGALLTISRSSNEDFKERQLNIYLDGERVATLMFGESFTREIEPGPHRLRVSNTLVWRSVDFDARIGDQVRFEAVNRAGKSTYPMLLIFGVGILYVTVRRTG